MTRQAHDAIEPTPERLLKGPTALEPVDPNAAGSALRIRAVPLIETMHKRGHLTDARYSVAARFARLYALAEATAPAARYDGVPQPGHYGPGAIIRPDHIVAARRELDGAYIALGTSQGHVLTVVAGQGRPIADFASWAGLNAIEAKGYFLAALDRLDEIWRSPRR